MKKKIYNKIEGEDANPTSETISKSLSKNDEYKLRKRLDKLLDEKKLRQELDEYDEYLGSSHYYDDDIFSQFYDRKDEE